MLKPKFLALSEDPSFLVLINILFLTQKLGKNDHFFLKIFYIFALKVDQRSFFSKVFWYHEEARQKLYLSIYNSIR